MSAIPDRIVEAAAQALLRDWLEATGYTEAEEADLRDCERGARAVLEAVEPLWEAEWAKRLSDETEHLVNFTDDGWTIQHPLAERLLRWPMTPNWLTWLLMALSTC